MSSVIYLYPFLGKEFDAGALAKSFLKKEGAALDPTMPNSLIFSVDKISAQKLALELSSKSNKPIWAVFVSFSAGNIEISLDALRDTLDNFEPILVELLALGVENVKDCESRVIEAAEGLSLAKTILR